LATPTRRRRRRAPPMRRRPRQRSRGPSATPIQRRRRRGARGGEPADVRRRRRRRGRSSELLGHPSQHGHGGPRPLRTPVTAEAQAAPRLQAQSRHGPRRRRHLVGGFCLCRWERAHTRLFAHTPRRPTLPRVSTTNILIWAHPAQIRWGAQAQFQAQAQAQKGKGWRGIKCIKAPFYKIYIPPLKKRKKRPNAIRNHWVIIAAWQYRPEARTCT